MHEVIEKTSKEDISKAIDILFEAWRNGNKVYAMGNGGSASTATHFAADLSKTSIVPGKKRFKAIGLTDNIPLMSAWTNDNGFENLFTGQLENLIEPRDVVVGFSVHGGSGTGDAGLWSQNLPKAMKFAKDKGAKTIGFSGFDGGMFRKICDACIVVPADSTPHVESFHIALHHLIIFALIEKIRHSD
ncbi:SIS domain-containing protein [Candidatus Woesearchaeota archaeon]|nr:SIS domain-containing protein [Candidatus Woesearchaeota archaeon]